MRDHYSGFLCCFRKGIHKNAKFTFFQNRIVVALFHHLTATLIELFFFNLKQKPTKNKIIKNKNKKHTQKPKKQAKYKLVNQKSKVKQQTIKRTKKTEENEDVKKTQTKKKTEK